MKEEKQTDQSWKETVDQLFDVIDPLADTTEEDREIAIDRFFAQLDKQQKGKGDTTCLKQ